MPEAGGYLFSRVGFSRDEKPSLSFQKRETFYDLIPNNRTLSLRFDMTQRFCIGWSDITKGERFTCPDAHTIDATYEQCAACQQRTGFNPAFYHATQVSSQQEARNLEPHLLYLAYFGKGTLKVGISHAARGNARLLEQGARYALILETFPTAHIARNYEARIAAMSGIAETIQLRKKITLLEQPIIRSEAVHILESTRSDIEDQLRVTLSRNHVLELDSIYFPDKQPQFTMSHDCSDKQRISGEGIGMLGSILFTQQDDSSLFLPLKKYIGYNVQLTYTSEPIELAPRQTSLF